MVAGTPVCPYKGVKPEAKWSNGMTLANRA